MGTSKNHSFHICFVISSMAGHGGAQRVMAGLVNYFSRKGYQISLVTLEGEASEPAYPIDKNIDFIKIDQENLEPGFLRRLKNLFKRIIVLRQTFKNLSPDLVISFIEMLNINVILAVRGLKVPVVVCERTCPGSYITNPFINALRSWAYGYADMILTQTKRAKSFFKKSLQQKIKIIPNVIPAFKKKATPDKSLNKFKIINVARLGAEKQIDLLIKAFSLIHEQYPEWEVVIYGEGAMKKSLESLRDSLNLQEKVVFVGETDDTEEVLSKAHIMAFPSRFEGFPNSLAEAISAGLPVIGFKEVSGVEDLIVEGKNGFLVDSEQAEKGLAKALEKMMSDASLRKKFGEFSRKYIREWQEDKIYPLWEEVVEKFKQK